VGTGLYVAALVGARKLELDGQTVVTATMLATLLWLVFLLVWASLLARFGAMAVTSVWLGLLLAVLVFISLFRFRGVSGDLVPLFEPRWRRVVEAMRAGGETPAPRDAATVPGAASDYPQFLGPDRTATVPGVRLARDWQKAPPRRLWRRPVGQGWSSFAVAGGQAITQERHGDEERVVSYDLYSGELQWSQASAGTYENVAPAGSGPRATPTVVGDRVYALGSLGRLLCVERESGAVVWERQAVEQARARPPEWGVAGSPLVIGDLVVVSPGGRGGRSLVAYDAKTGELRWSAGDDLAGYSSPLHATLAGMPQVVVFNAGSVVGHAVEDGRVLWRHPWSAEQPNVAQPLVLPGDRLLVSSGYGVGSELLEIAASDSTLTVDRIWRSPRLKAKLSNAVLYEGHVYGLDDGVLACIDPATGERCWKQGRYGHGQLLLVGELLLVQAEDGEVVLVDPAPEGLRELGRFQALDGKVWNTPAFSAPILLVRNDREAVAWELPLGP
jgi:outer membrane protein assembly factor BamB